MRPDLELLYRSSVAPIAFIDESFETRGDATFYMLGIALVRPHRLNLVRAKLAGLNGGHPIHSSDFHSQKHLNLLLESIRLVAADHDSADLIVASPLSRSDATGEAARQRCLKEAIVQLQGEFGTKLFILDSRRLKDADESDLRTLRDLRKSLQVDRATTMRHLWPSEEILLSLPDLIAWSYRQTLTRGDKTWFEPFGDEVKITYLPSS